MRTECKYYFYTLLCLSLLSVAVTFITGCTPAFFAPTQEQPTVETTPVEEATTTITREEAYIMVYTRLTNMAKAHEAKEYVTLFLMDSANKREYFDEDNAWKISISPGSEGYRLIKKADWLNVADINYFFDVHWDEPGPAWGVFDDNRILPLGKAVMIEADIEQLNSAGILE